MFMTKKRLEEHGYMYMHIFSTCIRRQELGHSDILTSSIWIESESEL